ncbi:MAG: hydroxylase [Planctomycetota bacterium]
MQVHYLEIVTDDVDGVCETHAKLHGVAFSAGEPQLGGARTAQLSGGGVLGVRAPLSPTETPVVRPYALVADIEATVAAATAAGALVALPPMKLGDHGTCAILIQGGVQLGLWQR